MQFARGQKRLHRIGDDGDVFSLRQIRQKILTGRGAVEKYGHSVVQKGKRFFSKLFFFILIQKQSLGDRHFSEIDF